MKNSKRIAINELLLMNYVLLNYVLLNNGYCVSINELNIKRYQLHNTEAKSKKKSERCDVCPPKDFT